MDIEDIPTAELTALVEQGLPLAEYETEVARRKALAAVPVTSDLVERLRSYAKDQGGWHNIDDTCEEAAAALTLANARIARLEEALRFYSDVGDYKAPQTSFVYGGENKLWGDCGRTARRALKGDA